MMLDYLIFAENKKADEISGFSYAEAGILSAFVLNALVC